MHSLFLISQVHSKEEYKQSYSNTNQQHSQILLRSNVVEEINVVSLTYINVDFQLNFKNRLENTQARINVFSQFDKIQTQLNDYCFKQLPINKSFIIQSDFIRFGQISSDVNIRNLLIKTLLNELWLRIFTIIQWKMLQKLNSSQAKAQQINFELAI
ncbi:unnamed protein product [Paramecium octaurelia]|uniref:Uncharacterized protein n=1 Tax=Paramecium octaurelia TaxID=43137 RepID=A0A8S1YJC3_PAROT|nr:unnamed protein product [Paramecium octaurelia]